MRNHTPSAAYPRDFLCAGLLAVLVAAMAVPAGAADKEFAHFITRRGNRLFDGEKPFRFIGANMPGLVLPYDYTLSIPERMRLPTPWEQEDAFRTLDQMNFRVVRLWNLPIRKPEQTNPGGGMTWHYVQGPGQFNHESFKVIDHLLALANRYQVRVIFDFTAGSGDYLGGIGTYAEHRGKKREEFYTDPQVKADYKATVSYVLNRVNTITGVRYKDDKAILAWQFGNEMRTATNEWLAEMAAYIKSLDPQHLVSETRHRADDPIVLDPNIDLYTRHYYTNYPFVGSDWARGCREALAKLEGQRPLYVGEFGPYIDGKVLTPENLLPKLREFLDAVRGEEGMCGALLWSMYFHHRDGGFYWHQIFTYPAVWAYHWPGFPSAAAQQEQGVLNALRDAAFQIQGLPIAPLPVPLPAEMLPVGDTPLLSWRGSAGASGYDIQRAAADQGPWSTVAANVADADTAYRPLFSDTTAQPGQKYFYRVVARNASGAAAPSAPVGPVEVRRLCLADELQDFARAKDHSPGLQLTNDYNGMYAEYMFRAKGEAGDWLVYEVPSAIQSVRCVAFYAGEVVDLKLQGSSDGRQFTDLAFERQETALPSPPRGASKGKRRTMVEYQCQPPAGTRWLKLLWAGPTELDRVEVYYGSLHAPKP